MNLSNKPLLKIDWATHEAAKFACLNWHYSKSVPSSKLVKIGAWEDGKFIGVVIFGYGSNPNLPKSYGLTQGQCVELVRVALTKHSAPVSQICARAIKFLRAQSPKIELIVSYADPEQGHHGGVYQAMGWVYRGVSATAIKVYYKGKWSHKKTVDDSGVDKTNLPTKKVQGKYTYLYPLTKEMAEKIKPLAKKYPKRAKEQEPEHPSGLGGATPTRTLHNSEVAT